MPLVQWFGARGERRKGRAYLYDVGGEWATPSAHQASTRAHQKRLDAASDAPRAALEGRPAAPKVSEAIARAARVLELEAEQLVALQQFADGTLERLALALLGPRGFAALRKMAEVHGVRRAWGLALAHDDPAALERALDALLALREAGSALVAADPSLEALDALLPGLAGHMSKTRHPERIASPVLRATGLRLREVARADRESKRAVQGLVLDLWTEDPRPALAPLGDALVRGARLEAERVALAKELVARRDREGDPRGILGDLLTRLESPG